MSSSTRAGRGRRRLTSTITAVLLLLAVACTPSSGSDASGGSESPTSSQITVGFGRVVPHLDRTIIDGGWDTLYTVSDPLFKIGDQGELLPGLVQSWESVDENTTRLELRQDVTFSSGEAFNAEALKTTIDRMLNEYQDLSLMPTLRGMEVVDEYTAKLLHDPQTALLQSLAAFVQVYSPEQINNDPESLKTAPIGTGPYEVTSYESGRQVHLQARDDYWGADADEWGQPSIDEVIIRYGLEEGVRLAGLRSGELDIVQDLTPATAQELEEGMRLTLPNPELYFLRFGLSDPLTSDPQVREAISLAIDKAALNSIFLGEGTPASQMWPQHVPGWVDRGPIPKPDLATARELITAAGVEGQQLEMVYSTEYKTGIGPMSEALAEMIEQTGLEVSPMTNLDGTTYRERIRVDDTPLPPPPLLTLSVGHERFAPASAIQSRVTCGGSLSAYCNEEADSLLSSAIAADSQEERTNILQQWMDLVDQENTIIPLIAPPLFWGTSEQLEVPPPPFPYLDPASWELN